MRRMAMSQGAAPPKAQSPVPIQVDRNMSGEEAYRRRLALAAGGQSDQTLVTPVSPSAGDEDVQMTPEDDEPLAASVDPTETGDDAYQRRLAISEGLRPTAPPFIPSQPLPVPPTIAEPPSPPRLAYNPFAPPTNVPPPPPPGQIPSGFEDKVKTAASIAARLSALAATAVASTSGAAGDSGSNSPPPPPALEEEGVSQRSASP